MALPGWKYKKAITVDNSNNSNTLTDYQVLVENPIYNETGLVGSWHFNEGSGTTAYDSSGNNNNGTINGATWTTGKFGSGLSFDGVNDYVSAPLVTTATNNITLEAWVKWGGSTTTNQFIVLNGNSGTSGYSLFLDYADSNRLRILCGGVGYADSNTQLTVGVWQHIVAVRDAGTWKLYLNGSPLSLVGNPVPNTPTSGTFIGANNNGGENFNGLIDEVRIYNRALSSDEIQALYNAKARPDYGDVRFTDTNGTTQLSYWQEKDGKFWVKVPSIPASSTKTIYLYYGNPNATSISNGSTTFNLFDDFNGPSLDPAKWTLMVGNSPSFANSQMTITAITGSIGKIIATGGPTDNYYIIRAHFKVTGGTHTDERAGLGVKVNTTDGWGYNYVFHDFTNLDERSFLNDGAAWDVRLASWAKNTWYTEEIFHDGTYVKGRFDDGSWQSQAWSGRTGYLALNIGGLDATTVWDWAVIRKYSSPEPTTSVGVEKKNITGASFLFNLV